MLVAQWMMAAAAVTAGSMPWPAEVRGEEFRALRGGTMVPGEHANVATGVLQPRDDKLPEAAGAASDKDGRGHGLSLRSRPCHIGGAWTVTSMTGNDPRM